MYPVPQGRARGERRRVRQLPGRVRPESVVPRLFGRRFIPLVVRAHHDRGRFEMCALL